MLNRDSKASIAEDAPVPATNGEPRPLRLHVLRVVPFIILLALLVHFVLPRIGTITESIVTARTLAPWAIALAIIAEAISYMANGELLQAVVCLAGERISFRRAAAIEIGAATISLVAAGALGFGAAIYRWTRNGGISADTAMLASWLPSVFDATTLIIFALISALELLLVHHLSRTTVVALIMVVSVLATAIAGIIVLLAKNDWMMRLAVRTGRIVKRFYRRFDPSVLTDSVDRAGRAWRSMGSGGWIRPAGSSFLILGFDMICLEFVFIAAGQHVHPTTLIAGYGVPLLLGRSSFLPGGLAVVEVAMAALFTVLGVPASVAVVVVLVYRLISFWLPTIVGIPIAFVLHRSRREEQVLR